MRTKGKKRNLHKYTVAAQAFFGVATFLIFAFLIIGGFVYPDERDAIKTDCRVFEAEWEQVKETGERIPVSVPGTVPAEYGEVVTLKTKLPEKIENGENLCFWVIWQDVDIYVGDELRVSYSTENSRPFGTNSAMRYVFVELSEADVGKELTYSFVSDSKYTGDMRECYIGDWASIWAFFIMDSGIRTVIAIFLLMLSVFCVFTCAILHFVYKKRLALIHLAWTIFLCALWMLSESAFRQIIFRNISVLSSATYWCLMLIPFPLLLYINDIQEERYEKFYLVSFVYSAIILFGGTLLQVLELVEFVEMVTWIHAGLAYSIVCLIGTIAVDVVRGQAKKYLFVGIGVLGLLIAAVMEMLLYYLESATSLGTVLGTGLLFLLIMAIIKTGQDLFESEKKKQQAIMAKEAQSKFLANMSHEIRTPINAVIGMNEMILRENQNEAVAEYANNVKRASNMLLELVNDILDFSKIESGQLELVNSEYDFKSLMKDEILLLNARAAGKPIEIEVDIDPKFPSVFYGDQLRIKQILTNLLSNAVKYTKEGTVSLKASFKWLDSEKVMLCFAVKDTGIGVRREDLTKLFAGFKRLELNKNHNIEGTGLGLSITKQLVDLMLGDIMVESVYGEGSVFTVTIPQKVVDKTPIGDWKVLQEEKEKIVMEEQQFMAPDATVLVVDDNAMNLAVIKELLRRTKVQTDTAMSGKECLELTKHKAYHVILMDHMMPEMDGVETLRFLREDQSNPNNETTIIALTANAIAGSREMYLNYGFDDYLAKPIEVNKLEKLLKKYVPEGLLQDANSGEGTYLVREQSEGEETEMDNKDVTFVDREVGLSYCMNSQELYKEVLGVFCKQSNTYIPQLEEHFASRNWDDYGMIAHALKGNSLNIGAVNFSKLSLQHEMAGKEKDEAFILAEYGTYIDSLKKLIAKVEEIL